MAYAVITVKLKSSVWTQQHGQVSPTATNKTDQRHSDNRQGGVQLYG